MIRHLLAVAALAVAVPALAGNNLVVNGGFEQTNVGTEHQVIGSSDLPGWTVSTSIYRYADVYDASAATKYTVSYDGGGYGSDDRRLPASFTGLSPSGGNFFGLDGDLTYGTPLTQKIYGLVAGQKYNVKFDWAATQLRNRQGPTTNQFIVSLGNESHSTPVVKVASQGFDGWYKAGVTFTATSSSETLQFLANGSPAGLPPFALLDGVSLTAVPEPAMWLLMVAGFGFVGVASRRRAVSVAA